MFREIVFEVTAPLAEIRFKQPCGTAPVVDRVLSELSYALELSDDNQAVTGVVLTGEGRGFLQGRDASTAGSEALGLGSAFNRLWRMQKPMLAAIDGPCSALGFAVALMCDLRFISEDAYCDLADSGGHIMSNRGLVQYLRRTAEAGETLDPILNVEGVSARRALTLGLVHRIYPKDDLLDAAIAHLRYVARQAPPQRYNRLGSHRVKSWRQEGVRAQPQDSEDFAGEVSLEFRADHQRRSARTGLNSFAQAAALRAPGRPK